MSNVRAVLARVVVPDLDAALPLYQELAGVTEVRRSGFRDTVLRAIELLRDEGLVFTVPRRGTYVSPRN